MSETDLRDDTKPGAITSEWWAPSDWNAARNTLGITGRLRRNLQLDRPEMTALLESSEQARRVLRPLCRALAMEIPWVVDTPKKVGGETAPRKRKPRPKPEPFRIPLPRGALTWARRDKALEKAIKMRNELVLENAKRRAP